MRPLSYDELLNSGYNYGSNCRYVFGITHVPRLEDWPVMPVEHIGFMLQVCVWNNVYVQWLNTSMLCHCSKWLLACGTL